MVKVTTKYINPASLPKPRGNYHWLVQSDKIVWLSGMVALNKEGVFVGKGDVERQTYQIYDNIEAALKECGGTLSNIVKRVIYVVGRENVAGMARVHPALKEAGRIAQMPASTLLVVAGLETEDCLIEIDVVAVLD
jgi:enamine deaminase RidA (YjgF/YER057c/UK114 family)